MSSRVDIGVPCVPFGTNIGDDIQYLALLRLVADSGIAEFDWSLVDDVSEDVKQFLFPQTTTVATRTIVRVVPVNRDWLGDAEHSTRNRNLVVHRRTNGAPVHLPGCLRTAHERAINRVVANPVATNTPPPMLSFLSGWYMHQQSAHFIGQWPPGSWLNAILLSWHATPEFQRHSTQFIEYYKSIEPIGCRDTKTQSWLRSHGVETVFTGCLTLTLPPSQLQRTEAIYIVDTTRPAHLAPNDANVYEISHTLPKNIQQSVGSRWNLALTLLKKYAAAKQVFTSRLHCALPCFALGTPVVFQSPHGIPYHVGSGWASAGRFDGLESILANQLNGEKIDRLKAHIRNNFIEFASTAITRFASDRSGLHDFWRGFAHQMDIAELVRPNITGTEIHDQVVACETLHCSTSVTIVDASCSNDPIGKATDCNTALRDETQSVAKDDTLVVATDESVARLATDCARQATQDDCDNELLSIDDKKCVKAQTEIALTMITDENYAPYVIPLLNSIAAFNSHHSVVIHLVLNVADKSNQLLVRIRDSCNKHNFHLKEYYISDRLQWQDVHLLSHTSTSTMDRLLLPNILPSSLSRVLYLDIDVTVLCDLLPLFECDTGECGICAKNTLSKWTQVESNRRGLEANFETFNAGVLVLDLQTLRQRKMVETCTKIVAKHKCNDQIALNAYCQGKHSVMAPSYNVFVGQDESLWKQHNILHFVSSNKPWNERKHHPLHEQWAQFM